MDPVRKIQTQKGVYYSDKCYKENFLLLRAGKEIPRDQFNTITDQIFSVCNTKMRGSYVTLEYNQKRFFFADNELFVYVNSLLQKVFLGKITIKNKKSKEIMKLIDKISASAQYEIEIEKLFTFKNLNDKPEYIKMDFLSTVSDAKKKLSEKYENKIKSDEIKILDENKNEIKNQNQKLIDIPNNEFFIFYKIADDSKAKKIFSDLNISKIAKDCYGYSNSITNYLVKNGLLYSDKCLKSQLHVYISGKEINAKDFKNFNDVDDSTISIKNDQNTVSLEYNNMKFIFSNDECISDAINLIKKTFIGCINVLILDENNRELTPDSKINQKEYSINADFKFTFKCINKDEHDIVTVLKYLGTVSDAKNILSISFCIGDQSKIVIFDDNKDEITDNSTKLIDIPNFKKYIFYDVDTSRGESIQIKKLSKSSISSKEIENESIKLNQTKEESTKTKKPKIKAIKPSLSKAEDHKEENKNADKKNKASDDKSDLLSINFVFKNEEFPSFKEELSLETTIDEISTYIKTKYNITNKIKICYKFGNIFVEIDSSINIDDICEDINIKGKNYLYIDIKKSTSNQKSVLKKKVLHPEKNDTDEKHHKNPDETKEDDISEDLIDSPQNEINFIDESIEENFTNLGSIGEGATAVTYKIIDNRNKNQICKKVIKYRKGQSSIKDAQNVLKEFEVLNNLSHPCICKVYGINTQEKLEVFDKGKKKEMTTIALFLEYLEYNLDEVLKMKINNTMKTKIVVDIVHAMKYLHKNGIMHRDLKIENIMLNSIFDTKLVDFGLAKITEYAIDGFSFVGDSLTRGVGTLAYMSPEMINEEEYDFKTDVYSFGVVLHYMFIGSLPNLSFRDKLNRKNVSLPSPSASFSPLCIELISKCMSPNPSKRPSFEVILNEMREKSYELADDVNPLIISKRDKELDLIEKIH